MSDGKVACKVWKKSLYVDNIIDDHFEYEEDEVIALISELEKGEKKPSEIQKRIDILDVKSAEDKTKALRDLAKRQREAQALQEKKKLEDERRAEDARSRQTARELKEMQMMAYQRKLLPEVQPGGGKKTRIPTNDEHLKGIPLEGYHVDVYFIEYKENDENQRKNRYIFKN